MVASSGGQELLPHVTEEDKEGHTIPFLRLSCFLKAIPPKTVPWDQTHPYWLPFTYSDSISKEEAVCHLHLMGCELWRASLRGASILVSSFVINKCVFRSSDDRRQSGSHCAEYGSWIAELLWGPRGRSKYTHYFTIIDSLFF